MNLNFKLEATKVKPKKNTKSVFQSFRMNPDNIKKFKELAKIDGYSTNDYINHLINLRLQQTK